MLEICTSDIESVGEALKGGADRIELCSALETGGLTPSIGLISRAVWKCSSRSVETPVHVLLRPRPGDFYYSDRELDLIAEDAAYAVEAGASGIVFGALTADGDVDDYACAKILETVRRTEKPGRHVSATFHRAFDFCRDPMKSLSAVAALGFERILTSGQAPDSLTGSVLIARLVENAPEGLSIMAGGGITPDNLREILEATGVREIHASAKRRKKSRMDFIRNGVNSGTCGNDDYSRFVTDAAIVTSLRNVMNEAGC